MEEVSEKIAINTDKTKWWMADYFWNYSFWGACL